MIMTMIVLLSLSVFKRMMMTSMMKPVVLMIFFRNPDRDMGCSNDDDGEFPNVILDADGEHDNDEAASDVHVIDADGVFHKEIEDMHSLIHTSGCEDGKGVVTDVDDIGDEEEVDTNSDGLVLRFSNYQKTNSDILSYGYKY